MHIIDTPWGEGADEAELEKVLRADVDKKIKAVLLVHNETTCGVTSDVAQCREAMDAAGHPALFFVDGVSSIGALEFKFDDWKVDVAITGSQKALSLPPGLALTCVSDKALEARKTSTMPKFFFELDQVRPPLRAPGPHQPTPAPVPRGTRLTGSTAAQMIEMNAQKNFPYTPAIPLLHGLREALDMLMEEGECPPEPA